MNFTKELDLAVAATRAAAEHLENLGVKVVEKEEARDIKLLADKESEAIILETLRPSSIPVLAEESGSHGSQTGLRWIVDPIDGTMNFFRGLVDLCCISVALWDGDRPILGVINRFSVDEIYTGIVGDSNRPGTALRNGTPIHPSTVETTDRAVYATGFPIRQNFFEETLSAYVRNIRRFKKIRMLGSAALMGVFVADGRCDLYAEDGIMLWDIAASTAILLAAGGCYRCTIDNDFRCKIVCCANPALLAAYDETV